MAIFIGVVMLGSILGFALMQTQPEGPVEVQIPNVLDHQVTADERVSVLKSGKTLIEYYYPASCLECVEKKNLYESFVESKEISGYAVLAISDAANETSDYITGLNGDRLDLNEVNTSADLQKLFCSIALRQPTICILQEL